MRDFYTQNNIKINSRLDTINTDKFWLLIDTAIKASNNDNIKKEQFLATELSKRSLNEINNFEIALRKNIIDADDFKIMAAQKIIQGFVSDDTYLYFRCWLIGQGKTVYSETLKNPDYLAEIVRKGDVYEFEDLLYIATTAYSRKAGIEENESFPRTYATKMGLIYDFGAPPTKGKNWTENELPTTYPKLWAKLK